MPLILFLRAALRHAIDVDYAAARDTRWRHAIAFFRFRKAPFTPWLHTPLDDIMLFRHAAPRLCRLRLPPLLLSIFADAAEPLPLMLYAASLYSAADG